MFLFVEHKELSLDEEKAGRHGTGTRGACAEVSQS